MAAQQKVQARPKNWLIPVTLVLLEEEDSYGYELMEQIEEEFGFEQINAGSVYRTLRQMEKEGLCSSQWDDHAEESGPPRRMYAITEAGEAYLEAWAEACAKYHRLMDQFAKVYGRRPPCSSEHG
ncbi:MAG: helix-turn-helix transcriptional regulator [Actinobacteria bacterium]|nr:helix-turn-helix transcriptional regulator [Actinomycetota bacterium]